MTDERTTTEGGRTIRGDEAGGSVTDDGDGSDRRTRGRRTAGQGPSRTEAGVSRAGGRDDQPRSVRSLRFAISLVAVVGYTFVFGAAVGAIGHLVFDSVWIAEIEPVVALRIIGGAAMFLPVAAFLYVALYDDADLTRPGWLDGHPPLVDAWILVLGASAIVTVSLSHPDGQNALWEFGWVVAGAAAYLALPLWLARRCLRQPSWVLGSMTVLLTPLLLVGAAIATAGLPLERMPVAAAVAVVGSAVPYGLAAASPGPDRLAVRVVELLS